MPLIRLFDFDGVDANGGGFVIDDVVFYVAVAVIVVAIIAGFILKGFFSELKKKK